MLGIKKAVEAVKAKEPVSSQEKNRSCVYCNDDKGKKNALSFPILNKVHQVEFVLALLFSSIC